VNSLALILMFDQPASQDGPETVVLEAGFIVMI